jgi:hypothetical protein
MINRLRVITFLKRIGNRWSLMLTTGRLLAQAKTFNNLSVPIRVTPVEIVQQAAAFVDHHDQPATRCMVLHVGLEMRRQVVDPLTEKRDLHFG